MSLVRPGGSSEQLSCLNQKTGYVRRTSPFPKPINSSNLLI
jgi:hypothetical protein